MGVRLHSTGSAGYVGSCQNYGPFFWGTLNSRCRTILGTQKGTIIFESHPCTFCGLARSSAGSSAQQLQGGDANAGITRTVDGPNPALPIIRNIP